MTDTLERIWIDSKGIYPYFYPKEPSDSAFATAEYIRADLCHLAPARCDELETEKWEAFIAGDWLKISGQHSAWKHSKVRELVTRQNAEEVIAAERLKLEATAKVGLQLSEKIDALEADNAAKDAAFKKLKDAWYEAEGKISDLEADNKRLREALETIADGNFLFPSELRFSARAALGEVKP